MNDRLVVNVQVWQDFMHGYFPPVYEDMFFQARAGGWGEPGAAWNPPFGARPKSTSWAGGDQDWQRKMVNME